jgi:Zn ribbon nucleic-acid-binding protein
MTSTNEASCPACSCPDHFDTLQSGELVYVCASCSYSWRAPSDADRDDNAATSPLQAFFAPIGAIDFE